MDEENEDADVIMAIVGQDQEEEGPQPTVRDHICRMDPRWQQELGEAINRCLAGTQQEIIMCCRGKRHAIGNANTVGTLLRHRTEINGGGNYDLRTATGIDIETDEETALSENPRRDDTNEYMIYVGRYGGWVITEEATGNVVERWSDSQDRLSRWRFMAWMQVERNRAWPRLQRLQFQIRAQIQQGRDTLRAEEVREIYRTESYHDFVWYNGQEEEQHGRAESNTADMSEDGRTEDVNIDMTCHDEEARSSLTRDDTMSEATEASVDESEAAM